MEGFVNWRIHPGYRRLATRPLAIIPTVIFVSVFGEKDVNVLLVFSQVLLSYALPFAVFPLVYFSSDPKLMGEYAIRFHTKILAYVIAFGIVAMNLTLLVQQIQPPE
jgi:manganese transport protein